MANMRRAYERIGIHVDNWKINLISLLGGHGNRKKKLSENRHPMFHPLSGPHA
jgi:hypothetical protein